MGNPKFDGTSISESHIGSAAAESLDILQVQAVPGGDLGNTQVVDLQVLDANGKPLKEVTRVEFRLFEATMIESVAAAWTMAETGAGTIVSTTANAAIVLDTDANGQAQVTITDVATATAATLYGRSTVLNKPSRVTLTPITFIT